MSVPVVLITEELSPGAVATLGPDVQVRRCDGTDRAALLAAVGEVDAMIVRSGTRVDAEVLAAAPRLRVVARAGVGLDNIDLPAATTAGVMVVNAPASNVVSAAEMTVGLLLAVARHIAAADASLRRGEWTRARFVGTELDGRILAVVGLGRVGVLVAARLAAFGMTVLAYDPYVQPGRAAVLGVELVGFDELLSRADVITIHLPRTLETVGLFGAEQLARVKPGVLLVNAARGGIVDEQALAEALRDGRVGGAGIDVHTTEPAVGSPLFGLDNVVVTPHLGASTMAAQEKAGLAAAASVRLALAGELVPDAVNVAGGPIAEEVRPLLGLAETLGRVWALLAAGPVASLEVAVRGEAAGWDVRILELAALKGVFTEVAQEPVSYVNAPVVAAEQGVEVALTTQESAGEYRNVLAVHGGLADGRMVTVAGTLAGPGSAVRIIGIDGYEVEITPTTHMGVLRYEDRPGVVGTIGRLLGEAEVNIAAMQVSRDTRGGTALVVLAVDTAIPADTLDDIIVAIGADYGRVLDLSAR